MTTFPTPVTLSLTRGTRRTMVAAWRLRGRGQSRHLGSDPSGHASLVLRSGAQRSFAASRAAAGRASDLCNRDRRVRHHLRIRGRNPPAAARASGSWPAPLHRGAARSRASEESDVRDLGGSRIASVHAPCRRRRLALVELRTDDRRSSRAGRRRDGLERLLPRDGCGAGRRQILRPGRFYRPAPHGLEPSPLGAPLCPSDQGRRVDARAGRSAVHGDRRGATGARSAGGRRSLGAAGCERTAPRQPALAPARRGRTPAAGILAAAGARRAGGVLAGARTGRRPGLTLDAAGFQDTLVAPVRPVLTLLLAAVALLL